MIEDNRIGGFPTEWMGMRGGAAHVRRVLTEPNLKIQSATRALPYMSGFACSPAEARKATSRLLLLHRARNLARNVCPLAPVFNRRFVHPWRSICRF
jgi:hypothetical protein